MNQAISMADDVIADRFRIIQKLGEGSLATVYSALDIQENRVIALKILSKQRRDEESRLRFRRDVEALSKIDHPNIVKILSCGEYEGSSFLAMELFEGTNLSRLLKKRKMTLDMAIKTVTDVAAALEIVHERGILHRDLKPRNILIKGEETKISDFCVARIVNLVDILDKPAMIDTLSYMSPELTGVLPVVPDERSDLYSLGIIFYELVTGEPPFIGDDIGTILHQHVTKSPKDPRQLDPSIPEVVANMVLKLLKKQPEERYQSARGLLADLERIKSERAVRGAYEIFSLGIEDSISRPSYHTKFIGRKEELAELTETIWLAGEGRGRFASISGMAGIGKTRLINELRPYCDEKGVLLISGKCNKYGGQHPFNPFVESITDYSNILSIKSGEEKDAEVRTIREALGGLGGAMTQMAPALEGVMGKMPELVKLEPERERMRLFQVIFSFFSAIASRERPLIIFLDDLQWSDLGTIELLDFLGPKLAQSPILILGSFREEEISKDHPLGRLLRKFQDSGVPFKQINLKSLPIKETGMIIRGLFGYKEDVPRPLLVLAQERTKGNPFYLLQVLGSMVDKKIMYLEENKWKFNVERMKYAELPSTVIELLLGRLERLAPEVARVLTYASAVGKEFSYDLLKNITKIPGEELIGVLDETLSHMFIWEKPGLIRGIYTFSHDKIREALYEKLDSASRKELHEEIARSLEEAYRENLDAVVYDLAYHYFQGLNKEKALDYAILAGEKAKWTYSNEDVIRHFERALLLLEQKGFGKGSKPWVKLQEEIGDAHCLLGEYDKSIACYDDVAPFQKTRLEKAKLLEKKGYAIFNKGDLAQACNYYEEGLRLLNIKIPKSVGGTAALLLSQVLIQMGHTYFPFVTAKRKWRESVPARIRVKILLRLSYVLWFTNLMRCLAAQFFSMNIAEHIGPTKELFQTYSGHGIAMSAFPFFKRALKYQYRSLKMAEEIHEPWSIAQVQSFLGLVHYYVQEWDQSIEWLTKATQGLSKLGDPWENILAYIHLGYDYRNKSDFESAQKYFEIAHELACRLKDLRSMGQSLSGLCEVLAFKGEIEKAEENIAKALEYCEKAFDKLVLAMALRDHAQILIRKGEVEKAIGQARRSKRLIEKYFFRSDYVVPTYLVLSEACLKLAERKDISKKERKRNLKVALRAVRWGLFLAIFFKNYLGYAYRVKGVYHCLTGNIRKGQSYFSRSVQILKRQNNRYELDRTLGEKARFLSKL